MDHKSQQRRIPDDPDLVLCAPTWVDDKCYRCERFKRTVDPTYIAARNPDVDDFSSNTYGHRRQYCAFIAYEDWPLN